MLSIEDDDDERDMIDFNKMVHNQLWNDLFSGAIFNVYKALRAVTTSIWSCPNTDDLILMESSLNSIASEYLSN